MEAQNSGRMLVARVFNRRLRLITGVEVGVAVEVMTVVEGRIAGPRMVEFEKKYALVRDQPKPPGWKRSMLLRDTGERGLYRISTLWESREALDEMRKSTKVPVPVALFREVSVEPAVRVFEIPVTVER